MLKNISLKMGTALASQMQVDKDKIQVYAYGLEIFLGQALEILLILLFSWLLNIFWPAILLLLASAGFRIFGGGVHLKTYPRCLVFSVSVILGLALLAAKIPVTSGELIIALIIVSLLTIYITVKWVPAGTDKKTITDPVKINGQKIKTGVFFLLWLGSFCLLFHYGIKIYILAWILGALESLFFITPLAYAFVQGLDNILDIFERR